jgi:hypothetical protein
MDAIIELARKTPQDADMQAKLAEALNKAGKKHAGQRREARQAPDGLD